MQYRGQQTTCCKANDGRRKLLVEYLVTLIMKKVLSFFIISVKAGKGVAFSDARRDLYTPSESGDRA